MSMHNKALYSIKNLNGLIFHHCLGSSILASRADGRSGTHPNTVYLSPLMGSYP